MHAIVYGCFQSDSKQQRPLWRIDTLYSSTYLLVVSSTIPDFTSLLQQLSSENTEALVKEYDEYLDNLFVGEKLRFRLTANPVRSATQINDRSARGKVYGHVTVDQQKNWLLQRSEKHGFSICDFDVISRGVVKFKRQDNIVTIALATFEGYLIVENVSLLRHAMESGIGRAKAYGCGLMTVART
jgi:CRISPR system Cascade subunit CasE